MDIVDKYEKLPEWVRWVLLLPFALGVTILFVFLVSFFRDDHLIFHYFLKAPISLVTFILIIYYLAPRWKLGLVLTSIILRMSVSVSIALFLISHGQKLTRSTKLEWIGEILAYIVSFYIYRSLRSENGKQHLKQIQPSS